LLGNREYSLGGFFPPGASQQKEKEKQKQKQKQVTNNDTSFSN